MAERWVSLGAVAPNPALQDNRCHLFLATGARPEGPAHPDPTEAIEVLVWTRAEVERGLAEGAIEAALGALALERALRADDVAPRVG